MFRNRVRTFALGCVAAVLGGLAWTAPVARAAEPGVIVDHPPSIYGGPSSDTDYYLTPGDRSWQLLADDVLLDSPATVGRITWWGFYNADNPPAAETMRVRFYDARPADGLPGGVLFEELFLNPSRVATGRRVLVGVLPREFVFQVELVSPFGLSAGTPYWVEIAQSGDMDSVFRWQYSSVPGNGYVTLNRRVPDWYPSTILDDMSYKLQIVPEPSTIVLLGWGATNIFRRSRKEVQLQR